MPEELKLLPCPACGSHATVQNDGYSGEEEVTGSTYVCCSNLSCSMCGPFGHDAEEAVRKWNALPRALVWTNEAPKVPGRYYGWTGKKDAPIQIWVVFEYKTPKKGLVRMKTKPYWDRNREVIRCHTVEQYELQWAGPIPEPREHK